MEEVEQKLQIFLILYETYNISFSLKFIMICLNKMQIYSEY